MKLLDGIFTAFSLFTILPSKKVWEPRTLPLAAPLLPVVGVVVGALSAGITGLLRPVLAQTLLAAVLFLLPLVLTGFLHLDGYLDCCDALFVALPSERRREILKDPRIGCFGFSGGAVLLLMGFSAAVGVITARVPLWYLIPLCGLSRAIGAALLLFFSPLSKEGLAATLREGATRWTRVAVGVLYLLCFVPVIWGGGRLFLVLLGALAGGTAAAAFAYRRLGGVSGDVCGFVIVVAELSGLLVMGGLLV